MSGPEHRSSMGVDRRLSTRSSIPPQQAPVRFDEDDDEGDDDDLQAMGISDGFRQPGATTGHNRMSFQASQNLTNGQRTPPPRPLSATKPQPLDTFALRHDGGMGANFRRISTAASNFNAAAPTRTSSVSTDMPYFRPESPYQGPSGPSHPYQMYPQESRLARTASTATTSTIPVPDRPYNGPGGPTYPYGMYPQNTVHEAETVDEPSPLAPVPVGFPGLNNNYQRRLGPDGEELADMIGPDGHTEQLPPYSKYPDEAFARQTRPGVAIPVAGAGGMGLATRNPEFASREDLESPSRQSTRTLNSAASDHQVNMAAVQMSEKPELKKWQKMARKKICGIVPVWVMILIALVFIMFGIILGTVLAVLKAKHGNNKPSPSNNPQSFVITTMTTTFDATLLTASPTGLPDLPTGTFALPISAPSAIQNSCISNTDQSAAWTCSVPPTSYTIVVTPLAGADSDVANNKVRMSLSNNTFGDYYAFGAQPPTLNQDQVLNMAIDSQEPEKGPAWFFKMPYNKVVILPEGAISAPDTILKREKPDGRPSGSFMRQGVAQPGDRPWFCYWNGTILETFIYANTTSSAGRLASTSLPPVTAAVTSTFGSFMPSDTAAQTSTFYSGSGSNQPFRLPPAYPNAMKIKEHRVRGPQQVIPYCVQQVIDENGAASAATNSSGQQVIIYLEETDPSIDYDDLEVKSKRSYTERDTGLSTRDLDSVACGCVWLWT